ncbi:hypothetical protein SASPL_148198 [Salvia splendens]|uniref:Uncharacterized protein n=1 Tax=Salvia splendens TaxID=180675 RepID=A0A8X8Z3W0_SALSN|nr:hypothetical protein SASPL_148198 [Salvia splendens]
MSGITSNSQIRAQSHISLSVAVFLPPWLCVIQPKAEVTSPLLLGRDARLKPPPSPHSRRFEQLLLFTHRMTAPLLPRSERSAAVRTRRRHRIEVAVSPCSSLFRQPPSSPAASFSASAAENYRRLVADAAL